MNGRAPVRPVVRAAVRAAVRGSAAPEPAAPVAWDTTNEADCTISNGDLTASTTEYSVYGCAVSTTSHNSSLYAFDLILSYTGAGVDRETIVALVLASLLPADIRDGVGLDDYCEFIANGHAVQNGVNTDLGIPVASGGHLYGYVNFDLGEIRLNNVDAIPVAASLTFAPNTSLRISSVLYSGDDATPVSATLNPGYTKSAYLAW